MNGFEVSMTPYKGPVPILTDFINSKYEGIFLKELSLFGTLSYLYSFIKSSYFENLAKLNHVNFVNLERPCFDDFFLCAAHHIPQRLKPRVISPPPAAVRLRRRC